MIDAIAAALPVPNAATPKNASEAAREFEALLIGQILNAAHEESGEEDSSESTMWSVAAQHFSRVMADGGGFGLAGMIERSLKQPAAGDAESV